MSTYTGHAADYLLECKMTLLNYKFEFLLELFFQ